MIITEITIVSKLEQSREKTVLQTEGKKGKGGGNNRFTAQRVPHNIVSHKYCLTCWNFGTRRRFTVHLSHRRRRVLYAGIRGTKGKPGKKEEGMNF